MDISSERSCMWSQGASVLLRSAHSLLIGLPSAIFTTRATVRYGKAAKDMDVDAASEDAVFSSMLWW